MQDSVTYQVETIAIRSVTVSLSYKHRLQDLNRSFASHYSDVSSQGGSCPAISVSLFKETVSSLRAYIYHMDILISFLGKHIFLPSCWKDKSDSF